MWETSYIFQNMYITGFHSKEQKIYSRNRITLPSINKISRGQGRKNKILYKIIIIAVIEIFVVVNVLKAVTPIAETLCKNKAKSIATLISNKQATVVMEKYNYQDLAVIIKDENGKIQMVKLNIIPVNEIISDVTIAIQEELNNVNSTDFGIRLGSITGMKFLSGSGPYIKVKMSTIGSVETELKSEFKTAGINQTLHQIYLDVCCEVSILTPFSTTTEKINNQILIAESIIVGDIPNSYYNFEDAGANSSLEVIE